MKKKLVLYISIILIAFISYFIISLSQKDIKITDIINKPSNVKNLLVGNDFYINDMQVDLIDSYPIASANNKMEGDGFMKGYHKSNTVFIFRIKDAKNLANIIKSVQLKKGKYSIGTNYIGYPYKEGVIIIATTDSYLNDVSNYQLEMIIHDKKDNKDISFIKKYNIKDINKEIKKTNVLKPSEIATFRDGGYMIQLTKKPELKGLKYSNSMEFKEDIKVYNFGKNPNLDLSLIKLVDKDYKDLPSKYKVSISMEEGKNFSYLEPKILTVSIKVNSTSEKEIENINKYMKDGYLVFK